MNTTGAKWVRGAALLGAAAVISKLLGTAQKIPLQNIAGDGAYGIYSAVYPFYILILFLATAGFPIAVSAFVSEYAQRGELAGARRVLRVAVWLLGVTGLAGFALLYFGAEWLARLIGNAETVPALRCVSFALLFVPVMSALRGYFQGRGDMLPTAVSQVIEQVIRVATMVALLLVLTAWQWPDRDIAAGATFGAVTGAVAGMAVMALFWRRRERGLESGRGTASAGGLQRGEPARTLHAPAGGDVGGERYGALAKRLLLYAIPVCLGAIAVPVMSIVDTFTLPRLLRQPGMDETAAMEAFGVYARGLPLVQMAAMLVSSVSVALVPAIAEARAGGDSATVRSRASAALRFTWLLGAAASLGLAVTALPVNIMLYRDATGTAAMAILAFSAIFSMMNITTAAVLQGAGAVVAPAVNLLLAAAFKAALNVWLTPVWGINGAAAAAVAAFALAAALNALAVRRTLGVGFPPREFAVKPLVPLALMAASAWALSAGLPRLLGSGAAVMPERLLHTASACAAIAVGVLVYAVVLLRLRVVRERELSALPGAGKLLRLLRRWRLV